MFRRMSLLEVGKDFGRVQTGDAYETRLEERQHDAGAGELVWLPRS